MHILMGEFFPLGHKSPYFFLPECMTVLLGAVAAAVDAVTVPVNGRNLVTANGTGNKIFFLLVLGVYIVQFPPRIFLEFN